MRTRSLLLVILVLVLGSIVFGCRSTSPQSDTGDAAPTATVETEEGNNVSSATPTTEGPDADTEEDDTAVLELVALVDGEPITAEAFREARTAYYDQYAMLYAEETEGSLSTALEGASGYLLGLQLDNEVLEQLTYRMLIEREVAARHITVDEEVVEAQQEIELQALLAQQGMTEAEFSAQLEDLGYAYVQFLADARESIRLQLQIQAVKQAIAGDRTLSDAEVDERFESWYGSARKAVPVVVYNPYIAALREREQSIDLGIVAFEELLMEEETANPYICYILGGLYQQKRNDALARVASTSGPDAEALAVEAEYYGKKALNRLYEARDWLAQYGTTDEAIEARIEILEQTVEYDLTL